MSSPTEVFHNHYGPFEVSLLNNGSHHFCYNLGREITLFTTSRHGPPTHGHPITLTIRAVIPFYYDTHSSWQSTCVLITCFGASLSASHIMRVDMVRGKNVLFGPVNFTRIMSTSGTISDLDKWDCVLVVREAWSADLVMVTHALTEYRHTAVVMCHDGSYECNAEVLMHNSDVLKCKIAGAWASSEASSVVKFDMPDVARNTFGRLYNIMCGDVVDVITSETPTAAIIELTNVYDELACHRCAAFVARMCTVLMHRVSTEDAEDAEAVGQFAARHNHGPLQDRCAKKLRRMINNELLMDTTTIDELCDVLRVVKKRRLLGE